MSVKNAEGIRRMKQICDHFNLGDKLVNYLKEDRLYYSYAISMDTINYDERYARIVKEFEKSHNAYVYHVIEARLNDGNILLSLLFVSDYEEDWCTEELEGNSIFTFTCCVGIEDFDEMGWIVLDSSLGYLMRVG